MNSKTLLTLFLAAVCTVGGSTVGTAFALPQDPSLDQARGEAALAEGRQAALEQRWQDAVNAYTAAARLLPGNAEATQGLDHAEAMLNRGSTIQNTAQELELRRNELRVVFDNLVQEGESLLQEGNYTEAERKVLTAEVELSRGRSLLQPSEFEQKQRRASELHARVSEAREAAMLSEQDRIARERENEALARQIRQAQERERLINENLRRVRQLQQELKYEEALQVIDQILFLDELNPAALSLRDLFRMNVMYKDIVELSRLKEHNFANLSVEMQDSISAPGPNQSGPGMRSISGLMQFPEDWPQITHLRLGDAGGLGMTAADRMIVQRLNDKSLPINFGGNTFAQVVDFFRQVTGVNMHVDWKALRFIGIDREDPVDLRLAEVPAWTAIDRVLEQLGDDIDRPQMDVQDGILVISTDEALRKRTVTIVYDIRDLLFEVPYFDNAPDLDLATSSRQRGSESVFARNGRGSNDDSAWGGRDDGENEIFTEPEVADERQTRAALVDQIVGIIQNTVDPDGWRDMGGETGTLQELNGNLIITNAPRQHAQIEGLLAQLREIRALQINVEGRFLEVNSDWFEQIGIDLDMYFNTNGGLFDQLRAVDPTAHLSDFFAANGRLKDPVIFGGFTDVQGFDPAAPAGPAFNSVPFGNIFGVPANPGVDDTIAYVGGPVGAPIRQTDGFSPIPFIQNSFSVVGELASLTPFGTLAIANPALVTGLTYLDDIQVDLLIEATQADQRTVVLTAPRLTFFNGQRSFVAITSSIAYVSGLQAVAGDNAGAFIPIIDTLREGFVLDVEGVISADRRYVTMTVIASLAQNAGFRETDAAEFGGAAGGGNPGGGGGGGAAGVFTGRVEVPQITLSLVQTTVSVPDKGTILLGGQRSSQEVEVESGVPVLSKIPFINRFFTNRLSNKEERTLLILIRPEIIISQEHEDLLYPGLLDSVGGALSR